MTDLDRRTVLRGAAVTGAIGTVGSLLAACGSDEDSGGESQASPSPQDEGAGGSTSDGGGDVLASTGDIPVGGGKVFSDQQVVVTQPTEGEFLGFTAVCTHQGCTVNNVSDGTINCPCHGSMFHIEDGSVASGPASAPLAEKAISVDGGDITLG
jgi:Rieske Fe-S protein